MTPINLIDLIRRDVVKTRLFFIIFYSIGLFGILVPSTRNIFIHLTPLALLLSFAGLVIFHSPGLEKKTILIFTSIYLISWLVEFAGVKTGFIFGSYTYGKGLGIKLFDTPLLIGVNWVLLLYCTSVIADRFKVINILKILASSLMMILFDIILEQVAPGLDMWNFGEGSVPVRNYISWFLLAFIFQTAIKFTGIKISNVLAATVFYIQGIFFIILTIFFKLA